MLEIDFNIGIMLFVNNEEIVRFEVLIKICFDFEICFFVFGKGFEVGIFVMLVNLVGYFMYLFLLDEEILKIGLRIGCWIIYM